MENDRKIQILKAAAKRFAKHGLNKTTLDEIARDLRIGKATIYHYFESKEQLFFATLEYDSSLFIEDIKTIFNNENISINERFLEYFNYKETIFVKYKLLYDLMVLLLGNENLEKETETLTNLLQKEEEIIKLALNSVYTNKIETLNPTLPGFIVVISWGILFGNRLKRISLPELLTNYREIFYMGLDNLIK